MQFYSLNMNRVNVEKYCSLLFQGFPNKQLPIYVNYHQKVSLRLPLP